MPISSASAVGGGIAATGGTPPAPELSASCIVGKTAAGSHTLTIDSFSRIKETNDRRNRMSATFTVGGHAWGTEFMLPRLGPFAGWMFMMPRLRCTHFSHVDDEVSAAWSFTLLDSNGQPSYSKSAGGVFRFTAMMSTAVKLVHTKFLESWAATYLPGDCLRVRCDVTVYKEPRCEDRDVPSRLADVPPPDINKQLGRLLSSGVGADLKFEGAGGETFAVHRHILAVRSPVLLEEISGATTCKQIGGVEAMVFRALLHYIYTDSLPEIDEGETADMARHLIAAANRYSLDRLKLICEDMLCRRVDTSTVAATLAIAEEYNCRGLKKACVQFLMSGSNLKAAMADGGFEHLRSSCPCVLKELLAMVELRSHVQL